MIIEHEGTLMVSIDQNTIESMCELHKKLGIKETLKVLGVSEYAYLKLVNCMPVQRRIADRALSGLRAAKG